MLTLGSKTSLREKCEDRCSCDSPKTGWDSESQSCKRGDKCMPFLCLTAELLVKLYLQKVPQHSLVKNVLTVVVANHLNKVGVLQESDVEQVGFCELVQFN